MNKMNIVSKLKTFVRNPVASINHLFSRNIAWVDVFNSDMKIKVYNSYQEYIDHQSKKVDLMSGDFLEQGKEFGDMLYDRLGDSKRVTKGKSVLCLGARLGYEVDAFIKHGCFAVGVDLNPGKDNKYVVTGDFHNLVWADRSVDIVYSNSLDHSFSLLDVVAEIKRVVKDGGYMILEVCDGTDEGYKFDYYESVSWKKSSDVVDVFIDNGFDVVFESRYTKPDIGKHVVLRMSRR